MDNNITRYDLADKLMELFPPDIRVSPCAEYSNQRLVMMLDYEGCNPHMPPSKRCAEFFKARNMGRPTSASMRMYLYGSNQV